MTPKEKAKELTNKYIFTSFIIDEDYENIKLKLMLHAKHSALIAVDEVIQEINYFNYGSFESYWQEVKQEIEKL
jgi:hypothetical protein